MGSLSLRTFPPPWPFLLFACSRSILCLPPSLLAVSCLPLSSQSIREREFRGVGVIDCQTQSFQAAISLTLLAYFWNHVEAIVLLIFPNVYFEVKTDVLIITIINNWFCVSVSPQTYECYITPQHFYHSWWSHSCFSPLQAVPATVPKSVV